MLLCASDFHRRLVLAPLLGADAPTAELLQRVKAEQLRFVLLSTAAFVSNSRGFPVLPSLHRAALLLLLRHCSTVILSPVEQEGQASEAVAALPSTLVYHQHFLHHLHTSSLSSASASAAAATPSSYQDYLQAPLQPLHDNLENSTYEVFERDAVKYSLYQTAITAALRDLSRRDGQGKGERVGVWVVGAGRGPLVSAVLAGRSRERRVCVRGGLREESARAVHAARAAG